MHDYVELIVTGFTLLGGAFTWLWTQYGKLRKRIDECEEDRALLRAEAKVDRQRIHELQGTCNTLTGIIRGEIHVG